MIRARWIFLRRCWRSSEERLPHGFALQIVFMRADTPHLRYSHAQVNCGLQGDMRTCGQINMTAQREKHALELIHNPPPGSALAAAKEFGVDLTLLISTLRLSPAERARALSESSTIFDVAKQLQSTK